MAVTVTHAKTVALADDPKAAANGEVLPSDWNANHVITGLRTVLTADTIFYYSTTGSNVTGDGTIGKPFATPQFTADYIGQNIDGGGHNVTMKGADGTYTGVDFTSFPPNCPNWFIYGNVADKTKVIWQDNGVNSACFAVNNQTTTILIPGGITFACNTTLTRGFFLNAGCRVVTDYVNFAEIAITNTSAGSCGYAIQIIGPFARMETNSVLTVSGNRDGWLYLGDPSCFYLGAAPMTLSGTPVWAQYGVQSFGGYMEHDGVITGTATGPGLFLSELGVGHFSTANAIPGSTAGQRKSGDINFSGVSAANIFSTYVKSGLPTTTDIFTGSNAVFNDTGTGLNAIVVNDGGTIKYVATQFVGIVSALPSAATLGAGSRAFVTDSNATLAAGLGNIVAGLGANSTPVFSDGTNWRIG